MNEGFYTSGTLILAEMGKTIIAVDTATRRICAGWSDQGAVPPMGSGTTFSFVMDQDSTLTWTWNTQYYVATAANLRAADMPDVPSPADGATSVSANVILDWTDCARAQSYRVYLWANGQSQPLVPTSSGLTVSQFPTKRLAYSTTYHWRVVAMNGDFLTSGPLWSFSVKSQPIRILSPNGGETLKLGSTVQIHWMKRVWEEGTVLDFELWRDGVKMATLGRSWSVDENGITPVQIPKDLPAGGRYRLRVVSYWLALNIDSPDNYDETDGNLTIAP